MRCNAGGKQPQSSDWGRKDMSIITDGGTKIGRCKLYVIEVVNNLLITSFF
jgi:hypothetical protein